MARTRNIKPGFFQNEELGVLDIKARVLFAGMWCWADREGRLEDRPLRLKAQILPFDDCNPDELLDSLTKQKEPFVIRYQASGTKYIQINKFRSHQNCHFKEQPSTIPAPEMPVHTPCKNGASTVHAPGMPGASNNLGDDEPRLLLTANCLPLTANCSIESASADSSSTPSVEGNRQVHKRKREKPSIYTEHFSEWWAEYPKRVEKPDAAKEYQLAIRLICKDNEIPEAQTRQDAHAYLLEKTKQFAASDKGSGAKQFILSPERWLKKECYKDDQAAWRNDDKSDPGDGIAKAFAELDKEFAK